MPTLATDLRALKTSELLATLKEKKPGLTWYAYWEGGLSAKHGKPYTYSDSMLCSQKYPDMSRNTTHDNWSPYLTYDHDKDTINGFQFVQPYLLELMARTDLKVTTNAHNPLPFTIRFDREGHTLGGFKVTNKELVQGKTFEEAIIRAWLIFFCALD